MAWRFASFSKSCSPFLVLLVKGEYCLLFAFGGVALFDFDSVLIDVLSDARRSEQIPERYLRAIEMASFIRLRAAEYASRLAVSELMVLGAWETYREECVVNFYQPCRILPLSRVRVYNTLDELRCREHHTLSSYSASHLASACRGQATLYQQRPTVNKQCHLPAVGNSSYYMVKENFEVCPIPQLFISPQQWPVQ